MQLSWQNLAAGTGLVFAALIAWFSAPWLNLQGSSVWVFRICIFILLALAVGAMLIWLRNRERNKPAAAARSGSSDIPAEGDAADDILSILREAEARIASSTQLPRGTRLSSLPAIFLLGGSASGKTCVTTQSGLEPELLSGQVYQEGSVAPTRLANLWFARKTIFIEMAGKTISNTNAWTRLLQRLSPNKFGSLFSGKPTAARAAVVCYDSEKLAKAASPEEITTDSRAIRARLEQISHDLGISFPVYVLFTHADRLPYFEDFFRNLSDAEITQALGVTLPPLPASATGVYAEQETKRLTSAFHNMFYSLADCRPGLLSRERNAEKLAGIYEFPRELQKRITLATQFLVDLCRPSHLRTCPFLRGFYFCGTRQMEAAIPLAGAAIASGTSIASMTSIAPARGFTPDATSLMRADDFGKTSVRNWHSATQSGSAVDAKKVTQWLFLSHIFSHVILQDRAALGASGSSSQANVLKRVLLATAAGLAAVWTLGIVISYFGNRGLEHRVRDAARAIASIRPQPLAAAPLEDLQNLEAARRELATLTQYRRGGAPLHLRWGLFTGNDLYLDFRALYFRRFHQLLLASVQSSLADSLRGLPAVASAKDDWQGPYESLKAHLMTTSHPEKSTRLFLPPVLVNRWKGKYAVDEQREALARAQFDFYADELPIENPFSFPEDAFVVAPARRFLNSYATGPQLVYQKMLAKTNQSVSPFNFAQKYVDAREAVSDSKIVDGAFTGAGWKVMTDAIAHPENYAGGDEWVLGAAVGGRTFQNVSPADVRALYEADYKKQWRDFLAAASVRRAAGQQEQSRVLEKLSGNRSPLLALLCEVSQNTSEASPEIAAAFQPVQEVVAAKPAPQSCREQFKQPSNDPYTNALLAVKSCLDQYLMTPQSGVTPDPRPAKLTECNSLSLQAGTAARQIVKTNDPAGRVDTTTIALLLAPTAPAPPPPPPGLKGVPEFCASLSSLSGKFPFDPNSPRDATLAEVIGFFQPATGALSQFLALNKDVLVLQGQQYVQVLRVSNRASLAPLVNQAASIQNTLYPDKSAQLKVQLNLKAKVPEPETEETVSIDGTELRLAPGPAKGQAFTWSGSPAGAVFTLSGKTPGQYSGTWGVFRLFYQFTWTRTSNGFHLEWPVQGLGGQITQYKGKNEVVEFELETPGVPLFQRGQLSTLRCPAGSK